MRGPFPGAAHWTLKAIKEIGSRLPSRPETSRPTAQPAADPTPKPQAAFDPFSPQNLTLQYTQDGRAMNNDRYRDQILAAARYYRLPPHAIAAMVGGEAMDRDGDGVWDPDIQNLQRSGAVGVTQFTEDTWLDQTKRGNFLRQEAARLGFLDSKGSLRQDRKDEWLALRKDPRLSIFAAADYAVQNLADLRGQGLINSEDPALLVKYAYLAHHEGPTGAAGFILGTTKYTTQDLADQVPSAKARKRYLDAAGGDPNLAYRNWMIDYVDQRVDPTRYMTRKDGVRAVSLRDVVR